MASSPTNPDKSKRYIFLVVLLVITGCALGAVMLRGAVRPDEGLGKVAVFEAKRGPLTISVIEPGTVKAREQAVLTCEVEGQTTIISLVNEGEHVNEGDLVVELDASNLQDQLVDQEIRVQNMEAEHIRASENLAVVENQAESDISKAELAYRFAQEDLTKYLQGEYPNLLREAKSKITLARADLERAADDLTWSQKLYDEKYISKSELDADRLAHERSELDLELAEASLQLLEMHTHKREVDQLESDVEQAKMALERTQRKSKADVVQAQADLRARESELNRQKDRLEKLKVQIEKTKLYAPASGMVIYATSAEGDWHGNSEPLDEGQTVRERQDLVYIPTAESMLAEVNVHESNLQKIKRGLPARVTVESLPGKVFGGTVNYIAPLPDATMMWMNPDLKLYRTEIYLDESSPDMRTGMTCRAEIVVERYQDVLYVPIQAVVRLRGEPVVFVAEGSEAAVRPVEVGLDNNQMIVIAKGLEEGERVLLAPPLAPRGQEEGTEVASASDGPSADESGTGQGPGDGPPGQDRGADGGPQGQGPGAMGAQAGGAPGGAAGPPDMEAMRRRFENMSPEQREAMRQRFQNMTPEQREAMRQRRGQGPGGAAGEGSGRPPAPEGGTAPAEASAPAASP